MQVHTPPATAEVVPAQVRRREIVGGLRPWLTTVDHKRIGILYLGASLCFFLLGGFEAFLMRLQLMRPGEHLVSDALFNQLFTMHGVTMIFLAVMPMSIGFINYVVPLQIGARDVAFPRLNAISLWLFIAGGVVLNSGWLLGGAPNAGWYNYAPLNLGGTLNPGPDTLGIDFYVFGLQLAGIGTLLTGINFLVTILNMRARGMSAMRMPLFVWATLVTMALIVFAFPPLTANLGLLMFDRLFHTGFFNVAAGGDVLLWQQLFWVFGHPEVYVLILPAFGMISEVIPAFSGRPLFGYTAMVFAILVIAFLAFMVWSHHMFTTGQGPMVNSAFAATSMLIAVPTGIKIFNWIATMAGGRIRLTTSMLFAIAFLVNFVIGGMSGVMLAVPPADYQFNGSYFLVAHIHYVLIGGSLFGLMAGAYYWLPKMTGRLLDERLGRWSFWLIMIGFTCTFFPMHLLGLYGMPRRVATYPPDLGLATWNLVSSLGVFPLTAGILASIVNLLRSPRHGRVAGADPWNGRTLEWSVSSPPPPYNFARIPRVRGRDALWVEKRSGAEPDAPAAAGPVHLPSPTGLPLLLVLGLTAASYAAIFGHDRVAIVGLLLAGYAVFRLMYASDRGYLLTPR